MSDAQFASSCEVACGADLRMVHPSSQKGANLSMDMTFTQQQAAVLARTDERNFRVWVDEGSVLPTPETAKFGRGKAKAFSDHEVRIACVLSALNVRVTEPRVSLAGWLRGLRQLKSLEVFNEKNPTYIIVEASPRGWFGKVEYASGIARPRLPNILKKVEDDDKLISVMIREPGGEPRPARSFVAANLSDALHWTVFPYDELVASIQRIKDERGEANQ